ncbi:MAG: efflux RND transporter periplasmic adaptor subunit [Planctomycetes bacterium]|nr:efflux RND transporter periplasmic adaptor subunit [Planctomycetota bacterium]
MTVPVDANRRRIPDPALVQQEILSLLDTSPDEGSFHHGLLDLAAGLTNARAAFLLAPDSPGSLGLRARYSILAPQVDPGAGERLVALASELASRPEAASRAVVERVSAQVSVWHVVLAPPATAEGLRLGIALELATGRIEPFLVVLQLLSAHLGLFARGRSERATSELARRSAAIAELLQRALEERSQPRVHSMLLDRVSREVSASQVALAFYARGRARVVAISGVSRFSRRSPMVRALAEAMSEAARERNPVHVPQGPDERRAAIDLAHRELLRQSGFAEVLSVPMSPDGEPDAVWTLSWEASRLPGPEDRAFAVAAAPPVGWLLRRLRKGFRPAPASRLAALGQRMVRIGAVLALGILVAFILRIRIPHHVAAWARLEPEVRRVVTAPFDGILLDTFVEEGEPVEAGDLLGRLDGRELQWELAGLEAARSQALKRIEVGLAQEEIAEVQMARLELERTELQIRTARYRLAHLDMVSPLAGVVLSGDLERARGASVHLGDVLFEVAPVGALCLEIAVASRDLAQIKIGMRAEYRADAYPDETYEVEISEIEPSSVTRDLGNVFICRATLANPDGRLRPGMEGKVRILAGERALGWILFHRPMEWLRLELWRF